MEWNDKKLPPLLASIQNKVFSHVEKKQEAFLCSMFQMRNQSSPNQRSPSARSTWEWVHASSGGKYRTPANNSTRRQREVFSVTAQTDQNPPAVRLPIKNLAFLIHLHTLWSEQCTMSCRTQTPSGKLMHELFLFIPSVPLTAPCYQNTKLHWTVVSKKRCSHNNNLAWNLWENTHVCLNLALA